MKSTIVSDRLRGLARDWSAALMFLAAGLVSTAAAWAGGPGIGALAPALPIPVTPYEPAIPAEPLADPCLDTESAESCEAVAPSLDQAPPDEVYSLGLARGDRLALGATEWVYTPRRKPRSWFGGITPITAVAASGKSVTVRPGDGPSLAFGTLTSNSPAWSDSAPIGGVRLSSWPGSPRTMLPEGAFGYSSLFGRLNYTDANAQAGGLNLGAAAGSSSLRYGLTPSVTVESQMEAAPSLTTMGLGTTYTAGTLGTFTAGATQSAFDVGSGRRYRLGYSVDITDSLSLGYSKEQIGAGFNDLADYQAGAAAAHQSRNHFSVGVPLGSFGTVSGTYSGLQTGAQVMEQRYGLAHSMYLWPGVKFSVGADRDAVSGNYEMRMQFILPVDRLPELGW